MEKQEQRPCYQQMKSKQRLFGRDKLKSIWLSPKASLFRGSLITSLEGGEFFVNSVHRLELSILHMPSTIPRPVLEPFNHCCNEV